MAPLQAVLPSSSLRINAAHQSSELSTTTTDLVFDRVHPDFDEVIGRQPHPHLHLVVYTTAPETSVAAPSRRTPSPPALYHEAGVWVERRQKKDGSPGSRSSSSSSSSSSVTHDIYITSNILTFPRASLDGSRSSTEQESPSVLLASSERGNEGLQKQQAAPSKKRKRIEICKLSFDETSCIHASLPTAPSQTPSSAGSHTQSTSDPLVQLAPGVSYTRLDSTGMVMANGATRYGDRILFCTQGQDHEEVQDSVPSSLMLLDPKTDSSATTVLNNFHGRPFNSLNDAAVHHRSGWIVFTDPIYGHEQGFKGPPQLPMGVWGWHPATNRLNMLASHPFGRPNGVVFSPDGQTCYVTDTDFIHGDGSKDPTRHGSIYAFDVVLSQKDNRLSLHNQRLFNIVDCGAPDGIKCDERGNVYTGCFDGVHVFNPSGDLIGRILLPIYTKTGQRGGCANLVFGPNKTLIILSETAVYVARLAVQGDLAPVVVHADANVDSRSRAQAAL